MAKDSKRFADRGGWGYGVFNYDRRNRRQVRRDVPQRGEGQGLRLDGIRKAMKSASIAGVPACAVIVVVLTSGAVLAQSQLSDADRREAMAMGQRCEAPLVRISGGQSGFDLYLESPSARVALVTAAAMLMGQPLESRNVRQAIKPGYRLWLVRGAQTPEARSVIGISLVSPAGEANPTTVGGEKLFLGSVPSHGIVPDLRDRRPMFTYASLPAGPFDVRVRFNDGTASYRVRNEPVPPVRVCNEARE